MMELEDNQLDFNQPLLTVRRFSPAVVPIPSETRDKRRIDRTTANLPPFPRYKSELKSGPVRNPGTVPFVWERSPGRPKDEEKPLNSTPKARVVPPKPPPGKNPKQQDSNKVNQEVAADRETDQSTLKCERVDDVVEEKADSGSEIDDEAFLDALETFSRSESQCLSCSVSGLSGVDGSDSRLSGRFSKEPPARDFMMGRFLPAAKAMASEAPANVIRKPQAEKDHPRHLTIALNEGKNTYQYQRKLNLRFVNDRYGFGEESGDDCDESENPSAKMCGLLPRFCLSNAVSSVGIHTTRSSYPLRRLQVKSSYPRLQGETCHRGNELISMRKLAGNFLKVEPREDNKTEPKAVSSHPISERDGKILEATSLYKLMQSGEAGKRQDNPPQTKRVWVDNPVKDLVVAENSVTEDPRKPQERQCMNFRQLLASEGSEWESGSWVVPVIEKTVYVDAVQMVESRDSDTSASDSRGVTESVSDDCDDKKNNLTWKSADDDASVGSSSVGIMSLDITQKSATPSAGTADLAGSSSLPASEGVDGEIAVDAVNGSKHKESSAKLPEAETTLIDDGMSGPETSSFVDGKIDLEGEENSKPGDPLVIPGIYTDFPIPPPLPKSPSDSWLSRTLPSMLSKNSGQVPSFAANTFSKVHPTSKPSAPVDPKWETIVKTSKVDRGHLRFSEELLAPIPESCAAEH